MLLQGQTAFDRPDVVVRVFHAKLNVFFENLKRGKYFEGLETIYLFRVIEYQKRGMPHAHVVVKLKDAPTADGDIERLIAWIDTHILARVPNETLEPELFALVHDHMTHQCSVGYCLDKVGGVCSKHFDRHILTERSTLMDNGIINYKRIADADLFVVPHNKQLLLDWRGHVNVECAVGSKSVLYLYRYLYKGRKRTKAELRNDPDFNGDDEIKLHVRGRYLCSMDAMWRLMGYETYPKSTPPVSTKKIMLPAAADFHKGKGKWTDIAVYFERPEILKDLTMAEFFRSYTHSRRKPVRLANLRSEVNGFFVITHPKTKEISYISRRQTSDCIIRIQNLFISSGDIWFLRLIMVKCAVISFLDARTVNGICYTNFQLAAVARGLVTERDHAFECYRQHMTEATASELRGLFSSMTLNGLPTAIIYEDKVLRRYMMTDYLDRRHMSNEIANQHLLLDLAALLKREDKLLSDYGLPMPVEKVSELQEARGMYDAASQRALLQRLNLATPNNVEQQRIFDVVSSAIRQSSPSIPLRIFFIQGTAGTGKTAVTNKLLAFARSEGKIAVPMAATTLACLNFDDAVTAHSFWKFPVIDEDDRDPEVTPQ
jgi:hypothetical protein